MKAMFSVEEAGSVAAAMETESQGLLAEFVDFVQVRAGGGGEGMGGMGGVPDR